MRRAIDTNVLVYAHVPAFAEHDRVARYVRRALADPDVVLVLTPLVLHELVHVLTDPRRFEPPVSMAEALAVARSYTNRANVEVLPVGQEALVLALQLLERHRLGRKRIADTLFAATLLVAGVVDLVTCDPGGFAPFEGIRPIDPRTA